jgi:hypothetical protein
LIREAHVDLWEFAGYSSKGLQKMGNIHTVGPNEALIVSGESNF